ncbi:hypothetical protein HY504_01730 [Candidatus Wolfebacteria bacterium]|nr:hypothetical protein [Candidatus Wolfebacteria bacterium]
MRSLTIEEWKEVKASMADEVRERRKAEIASIRAVANRGEAARAGKMAQEMRKCGKHSYFFADECAQCNRAGITLFGVLNEVDRDLRESDLWELMPKRPVPPGAAKKMTPKKLCMIGALGLGALAVGMVALRVGGKFIGRLTGHA